MDIEVCRFLTYRPFSAVHAAVLWHRCGTALFVAAILGCHQAAAAAEQADANTPTQMALQSVTGILFDDTIIAQNVVFVREHAKILSPVDRYNFLRHWVLPSDTHSAIRLSALLTPGDPVVPLIGDHPFDIQRQSIGKALGQRRIHTGGNLVSPAFDLVRIAQKPGRLTNLRSLIDGSDAATQLQKR